MDIQKLTQDYKERFFAYAEQVAENPPKKGKKKSELESPNFLKEVIRPILDALVDLLPEYGSQRPRTSTQCTANTTVLRRASYSLEVSPLTMTLSCYTRHYFTANLVVRVAR